MCVNITETKICSKCETEKFFFEFNKGNDRYGLRYWCKLCCKQHSKDKAVQIAKQRKQHYRDNSVRLLKRQKQYYKNNVEERAKYQKQYYIDNVEKIVEQKKQYYTDNVEQKTKYQRQYNKNNVEKIAKYQKQYYKNNSEYLIKQHKQYCEDNCEKIAKRQKQYQKENVEKIAKYQKQYRKNNITTATKYQKQYNKDNVECLVKKRKQRSKNYAAFKLYCKRLGVFEEIRQCPKDLELLEVKCAYCGKWMRPTNRQVSNCVQAFNGNMCGEHRFYCSEKCKQACPIFNQKLWPKGFKKATSREVVPLLRQLVLKRDNYICQKCGATTETAQLHVHHEKSYMLNKIMANDPDNCITLCKECHKEIHKQNGCRYSDLKC